MEPRFLACLNLYISLSGIQKYVSTLGCPQQCYFVIVEFDGRRQAIRHFKTVFSEIQCGLKQGL